MDLKKLIAQSKPAATVSKPIPQAETSTSSQPKILSSLCICGHPRDAHDSDAECGILECECVSFSTAASRAPITSPVVTPSIEEEIEKLRAENEALSRAKASSVKAPISKVTIENSSKTFPEGESPDPLEECCHICQPSIPNSKGPQGCGLWWSHGPRCKCKHPDLVNHGLCPKCLDKGTQPYDPLEDFDDDKMKLTPQGIMKSENKARIECADMDVEQLTHHILFLSKQVEMLRAEAMGTKKLRTEKEEEALLNIPAAERDKFIQALRQGKDGKTRKPRVSKPKAASEPGIRLDKYERSVRNLMATTGKTRAQVEAYLNG